MVEIFWSSKGVKFALTRDSSAWIQRRERGVGKRNQSMTTIKWRNGELVETADGSLTVRDPQVGECYHSQMGAKREARELYLEASGLAELWQRMGKDIVIRPLGVLDVGLGLGYNAGATLEAWWSSPAPGGLCLHSLEIDPELVEAIASGQAPWQTGWEPKTRSFAQSLRSQGDGRWTTSIRHPSGTATCEWTVMVGDAPSSLGSLPPTLKWDYIWQDPFSPDKNPSMWTASWFQSLRLRSHPETVLLTYSVARAVRDNLASAGWAWEKFPSHSGIKRHWLRARPAANLAKTT